MATWFEVVVAGQDEAYARQAAAAAWRELERLESELSRYVESSDIARANRLSPGETISIGDDAMQCLLASAQVSHDTRRAFDPAYASERSPDQPPGAAPFTLDPSAHTLTSRAKRLHLDLGAVGKGFALDRMADTLEEWGVRSALLNSGGSTVLALEPPPGLSGWTIGLGEGAGRREVGLTQVALSGSGIAVKGAHLIDPRTGRPAGRPERAWALAPSAAVADALSTAFFVLTDREIESFCAENPSLGGAVVGPRGGLVMLGAMRKLPSGAA
jgi:thiamine biosynthesis lipoprotein